MSETEKNICSAMVHRTEMKSQKTEPLSDHGGKMSERGGKTKVHHQCPELDRVKEQKILRELYKANGALASQAASMPLVQFD